MQAIQDSVKELINKVETLVEQLDTLYDELDQLSAKNNKLEKDINTYKAENQRLKAKLSSDSQEQHNGQDNKPEKQNLRIELEQYIEELDVCIEKLKNL